MDLSTTINGQPFTVRVPEGFNVEISSDSVNVTTARQPSWGSILQAGWTADVYWPAKAISPSYFSEQMLGPLKQWGLGRDES